MATYNNIIKAFSDFADNHQQLNTFFSGGTWDFQTMENIYPAMVMLPQSSTIVKGAANIVFNVFICDILKSDKSNMDEIYSDTLQISQDMISFFKDNDDYDFYLDETSVNIEPTDDILDDIVCGWVSTITIQLPYSGSTCGLPIS